MGRRRKSYKRRNQDGDRDYPNWFEFEPNSPQRVEANQAARRSAIPYQYTISSATEVSQEIQHQNAMSACSPSKKFSATYTRHLELYYHVAMKIWVANNEEQHPEPHFGSHDYNMWEERGTFGQKLLDDIKEQSAQPPACWVKLSGEELIQSPLEDSIDLIDLADREVCKINSSVQSLNSKYKKFIVNNGNITRNHSTSSNTLSTSMGIDEDFEIQQYHFRPIQLEGYTY